MLPSDGGIEKMRRRKKKKEPRQKLILVTLVICVIILTILGIFVVFCPMPKPSMTSILGERQNEDGRVDFSNGDYIFTPDKDSIAYDEDNCVIFFNNQLIVYTFSEMSDKHVSELAEVVNGDVVGRLSGSINALQIRVKPSSFDELNSMAAQLMEHDDVLYAGYDYPIQMFTDEVGNDAKVESMADSNPWSSNPHRPDKNRGEEFKPSGKDWWAEAIGAYTAWQYSNKCRPIKVGIVDNGFDTNHDDLAGHITLLPDYSGNTIEDHGTHVAGIIGARNNEIGIRGVADSADLLCADWSPNSSKTNYLRMVWKSLPFLRDWSPNGSETNYLSTGEYLEITKQLIENGVRVINNSWVNYFLSFNSIRDKIYKNWNLFPIKYFLKKEEASLKKAGTYDSYLKAVETYGKRTALECTIMMIQLMLNDNKDFLIVQSAGNGLDNSGPGVDATNSAYFCAIGNNIYNLLNETVRSRLAQRKIDYNSIDERILIVGAVEKEFDSTGYKMTQYSNFGPTVDICAPGGYKDIFSTLAGNKYGCLGGTSMAAPMVTGSAAFIWSLNPDLTAPEVRNILLTNTISQAHGVGNGSEYTYPMLNVGTAAKAACVPENNGGSSESDMSPDQQEADTDNIQPIRLQKYIGHNMMFRPAWNTVRNSSVNELYSGIRIAPEDESAFPELKKALASFSEEMKTSQQNRTYNEFKTIKIKRSDSVAVSILTIDQIVLNESNFDTVDEYSSTNIDTKTGQSLALTDVIADLNSFTELVQSQLIAQWKTSGGGNEPDYDLLSTTLRSGPSWTLDPDGITIYFNQYEFSDFAGQAVKPVKIQFRGNEGIFSQKYTEAPVSYAYEVPMDCAFFSDVNQDGAIDRISISYSTSDDGYASTNIDVNGIETSAEARWYEYLDPLLVHLENGSEYLMVEGESEDSWVGQGYCNVFNLSDGTAIKQASYPLAYYNCEYSEMTDSDIAIMKEIPTNVSEARFTVRTDMLGTSRAHSTCQIGNGGKIIEINPWYIIDDYYQTMLTLRQPLTTVEVDEAAGAEIGEVTLEAGEKVRAFRTDNSSYCDVIRKDNTIARIFSDTTGEGWISKINGVDVHSVFDGIHEYS